MLIKELNIAVVDSLCDLLSDLVRAAALNHVQPRPAILRLRTGRGAHEEVVLELALEVVLLDVVCQGNGHFPVQSLTPALHTPSITSRENELGIPNARKTGPSDVRAMRKQID